jgi:hypothetical protein
MRRAKPRVAAPAAAARGYSRRGRPSPYDHIRVSGRGSLTDVRTSAMSKVLLRDTTDLKIVAAPMREPEAQIGSLNKDDAQLILVESPIQCRSAS